MPFVFAMTVIVIAATFGFSANRSVISSQAATETHGLFRNRHQRVLNKINQCSYKTKKKIILCLEDIEEDVRFPRIYFVVVSDVLL